MKTFCRFFSFVLFLLIVVIVLLNSSNTITLETNFLSLRANVGFLILFCAVVGGIATLLFVLSFSTQSKQNQLKKQLEQERLDLEVEFEKVKQLEAKIQTLEEALKMATKRRS